MQSAVADSVLVIPSVARVARDTLGTSPTESGIWHIGPLSIDVTSTIPVVEFAALVAVIIYVIATLAIAIATKRSTNVSEAVLKEMKASREQEIAPYVDIYFDIPYGEHFIFLVVKNSGRSVARNVRFRFDPPLKNSHGEDINGIPLISQGIKSISPGQEIRTVFDVSFGFFGHEDLLRPYHATVSYECASGLDPAETLSGNEKTMEIEKVLDLSVYKGLEFIEQGGLPEVAKQLGELLKQHEKVPQHLASIARRLSKGLWFLNPELLVATVPPENEPWRQFVRSKLKEFRHVWADVYGGDLDALALGLHLDLRRVCRTIAHQITVAVSRAPGEIQEGVIERLAEISKQLLEIPRIRFLSDGGRSVRQFDSQGNKIVELIDEVLRKIDEAS